MMTEQEIEQRLGAPPGKTLAALVELAEQISPSVPWNRSMLALV